LPLRCKPTYASPPDKPLCDYLQATYADHEWLPWKFENGQTQWANDLEGQAWFVWWLCRELGSLTSLNVTCDALYKLTREAVANNGGTRFLLAVAPTQSLPISPGLPLLRRYDNTLFTMLKAIYPDVPLLPWKFSVTPRNYWLNPANRVEFLDWLKVQHKLSTMEDLYKLKQVVIETHGTTNTYTLPIHCCDQFRHSSWIECAVLRLPPRSASSHLPKSHIFTVDVFTRAQ